MKKTVTYKLNGAPLIKFQNKNRLESFQKGIMYMKSLEFYRELERKTNDTTVGDSFEAMIHINNGTLSIPEKDVTINLSDELITTSASNSFVFCMFGVNPNTEQFQFTDEQKEKLLEFGDSALLITDTFEFIRRVEEAIKRDNLKATHKFVKYFDETIDNVNYWVDLLKHGINEIAFSKRKIYECQQEYRFVIDKPTTENDFYELNIGDISDISVILSAKEALSSIAKSLE